MACCRVDLNGFIIECNDLLVNLFCKSSRAELISTSLLDLIDSTSYEQVDKILESSTTARKGASNKALALSQQDKPMKAPAAITVIIRGWFRAWTNKYIAIRSGNTASESGDSISE